MTLTRPWLARPPVVQAVVLCMRLSVVLGLAILAVIIYCQFALDERFFLQNNILPILNVSCAGVFVLALLTYWVTFFRRVSRCESLVGVREGVSAPYSCCLCSPRCGFVLLSSARHALSDAFCF